MAGEHPHSAVQTQTQTQFMHHPHSVHDREHEHDVKGLRLALGSILSPKRIPSSRASASSSGTASPAHFGPGLVHPYPYPHSQAHGHGHGYAPHEPSHLHTPAPEPEEHDDRAPGALRTDSGLSAEGRRPVAAMLRQSSASSASSYQSNTSHQSQSQSQSQPETHLPTPPSEPTGPAPSILTTSNVHTLTPAQTRQVLTENRKEDAALSNLTDAEKEKMKQRGYIATLQSGRAWDALVHGNMS